MNTDVLERSGSTERKDVEANVEVVLRQFRRNLDERRRIVVASFFYSAKLSETEELFAILGGADHSSVHF